MKIRPVRAKFIGLETDNITKLIRVFHGLCERTQKPAYEGECWIHLVQDKSTV